MNVKRVTEAILGGANIRKALSGAGLRGRKPISEASSNNDEAVRKALSSVDLGGESVDTFLNKLKEYASEGADGKCFGAYFPEFASFPYWIEGYGANGVKIDSCLGKMTVPWDGNKHCDIVSEVLSDGGGDYSEVSYGGVDSSPKDIIAIRDLVQGLGIKNDPDNWMAYKGFVFFNLGPTDGEITSQHIAPGVISFDGLTIKVTKSNVKKIWSILKKFEDTEAYSSCSMGVYPSLEEAYFDYFKSDRLESETEAEDFRKLEKDIKAAGGKIVES